MWRENGADALHSLGTMYFPCGGGTQGLALAKMQTAQREQNTDESTPKEASWAALDVVLFSVWNSQCHIMIWRNCRESQILFYLLTKIYKWVLGNRQ